MICSDEIHCDLLLDKDARHPLRRHQPRGGRALGGDDGSEQDLQHRRALLLLRGGAQCPSAPQTAAGDARHQCRRQPAGLRGGRAAYEGGEQWLSEQLDYLAANLALIKQAVARWPGIELARHQATYLAWIDMSALGLDDPIAFFEQAGVGLSRCPVW